MYVEFDQYWYCCRMLTSNIHFIYLMKTHKEKYLRIVSFKERGKKAD